METKYGFQIKRYEDLLAQVQTLFRTKYTNDIKLTNDSVAGILASLIAEVFTESYEVLLAVFNAFNPDTANGKALDFICTLNGINRNQATKTIGEVTFSGTNGIIIPASTIVSDESGNRFNTISDVTIALGVADVQVEAQVSGRIVINAGEITKIVTPIFGVNSVANDDDFVSGMNEESDSELRKRRLLSFSRGGKNTDYAIESNILDLDYIDFCRVVSNRSLLTDSNGIPAKSFCTYIYPNQSSSGEREQEIAEIIFANMPCGIQSFGDVAFEVQDSDGFSNYVGFSYATEVPIVFIVNITTKPNFPVDGSDQIKNSIVGLFNGVTEDENPRLYDFVGNGLGVGGSVLVSDLIAAIKTVQGIRTISILLDKKAEHDPPINTVDIDIDSFQIATIELSDIEVNIT